MENVALTVAAVFTFGLWTMPVCAAASDGDNIVYEFRPGDTLIGFGQKYLLHANDYRILQRQNNIADPVRIPVGRKITVPRSLLKFAAAKAKVISVRGRVMFNTSQQLSVGQSIGEGASITTAGTSFITLSLDDGSRISVPSNSDVRIRRLRSYVLGGALDYDFDVAKGSAQSKVIPLKTGNDRYQVRTPKAVSAVRGTDFQSRYDADQDRDFAEVVEGGLAVGTGTATNDVPAGNGIALTATGDVIKEAMLVAPTVIQPGRIQVDPAITFATKLTADAAGYRYSLAADAGFIDQVADTVAHNGTATFNDIGNGNYFVRARAISANGIEGLPVTYAFKRRLNGVSASAGKGDDGYNFKWLGQGEGVRRYHFQLYQGTTDSTALVDEASLDSEQINIADLPPGEYYWRIGATQYLDNEAAINWTTFEKLIVAP